MHLDETSKSGLQILDAEEGAAVQGTAFELGEPAFDRVQPRGAGPREVEMHVRMSRRLSHGLMQPLTDHSFPFPIMLRACRGSA